MDSKAPMIDERGSILLYKSEDGTSRIDAYFVDGDIWLNQRTLSELYQASKSSISEHISSILEDGELTEQATVRSFRTVQVEGNRKVNRLVKFYNLKMILAVGYRVRNHVGNHFRNWASSVLSEYMQKGFVLDDRRLKNPREFGADYFDELLERIRDIRSSEKRLYKQVLEIYSLSADYDPKTEMSRAFFQTVQNKLHYAVSGQTAAEIIFNRADASKPHMGLKSFEGVIPRKAEVSIAKNYLMEEELSQLNLIVSMYLDYAELMARRRKVMYMADWITKLDTFLQFNEREILQGKGAVSRLQAKVKAELEYDNFRRRTSLPSPVEKDYHDSISELKALEDKTGGE